jgi:hypothetical protein
LWGVDNPVGTLVSVWEKIAPRSSPEPTLAISKAAAVGLAVVLLANGHGRRVQWAAAEARG